MAESDLCSRATHRDKMIGVALLQVVVRRQEQLSRGPWLSALEVLGGAGAGPGHVQGGLVWDV